MKPPYAAPALLAWMLLLSPAAHAQTIQNPSFEGIGQPARDADATRNAKGVVDGQIAAGWADNSIWADVDIHYALDTENPHSGRTAQRIEVARVSAGGAGQFVQRVHFSKNHIYRFSVWLKGPRGQSVDLSLRQESAPYKTYASLNAPLSTEWQPYQVWGQVTEDAEGYLMLRAGSPVQYWVDDAQFEDLTDAKSNAAPKTGNLLPGGNFEAGLSFGWSGSAVWNGTALAGEPNKDIRELRPYPDSTTAAVGKTSLRFDIPPNGGARISTPAIQTNFGRPHTFSVWLKASQPNTNVRLELALNNELRQDITVGTEWQRFTWTHPLPLLTVTRYSVVVWGKDEPRTVWLDGAQLEEKPEASPQYVPDAPHEMTLRMPRFGSYVFDGETARAQLCIVPTPPPSARLRLSYQSLGGAFQPWKTVAARADQLELPAFNGARGIWKLRAQLVDAGDQPLSSPVELVWARLPRPRQVNPRNSPFGIHLPLQRDYLQLARDTGHKWNRLHDLSNIGKWAYTEWDKNQWRVDDEAVNLASQYNISLLGMLDGAPARATTKSRGDRNSYWGLWNIPDAPGALDEWRNYVRTVTTHYKGRIDDWEVWNEPWGNWFITSGNPNATPQLYGQLLNIASEEAKKANPAATVLGIDTFPGRDDSWTIPALKASGNNPYDAFSFHDYNDTLYGATQPRAAAMVTHFEELQKQTGAAKPQWMTEGGPPAIGSWYTRETGGLPPEVQPAFMVRYDVSHLAAGTRRIFLYSVRASTAMGDTGYQATEQDGALRPILAARAVLASLVDGAGQPVRNEAPKGVDSYTFPPQNGRQISVLWAYDNQPHEIEVPKGAQALDIWGNPLRTSRLSIDFEPVYFVRQ